MIAMRRLGLTMSIIASLSFTLLLAPLALTNNNTSFAQMQNATNQTSNTTTPSPPSTNNTSGGNQSQPQGGNPLSKVPVIGELFGGGK